MIHRIYWKLLSLSSRKSSMVEAAFCKVDEDVDDVGDDDDDDDDDDKVDL